MEWLSPQKIEWTILGLIGAGLSVGARLGRGEKVNHWSVITTLAAGAAFAGTCTEALVNFARLEPFWAGGVALLIGLMIMGLVINALDGKIPVLNQFINKVTGGAKNDVNNG